MIEVAHAILKQHADVMNPSDLVNQIQNYLGKSDSEIRDQLTQFCADLGIDGSFVSLGDNHRGLRSWHPADSINEEVTYGSEEDEEDAPRRRKHKGVNTFITNSNNENIIDYNGDGPEDAELASDNEEDILYDDEEDEDEEIKACSSDLQEIGTDSNDDEEDIPQIGEDSTTIDDDDVEDKNDFDSGYSEK